MANLFLGSTAKQIFLKAFVAAYKDHGVPLQLLSQWIRLSLSFEDPTKTLDRNMLFTESVPKFAEIFQTGVCVYAFGVNLRSMDALRRYWSHEWIISMILGRQTIDDYSQSPLIQYNDHSHVTDDLINYAIQKYIGQIEQINPLPVLSELNPNINRTLIPDLKDDDDDYDEDDHDHGNPNRSPRITQCYSIELLARNQKELQFRIFSDGLFNCRAFVRDLSMDIGCPSSIESLHLAKVGPISSEQALKKHELHYDNLVQSAEMITTACSEYLKELRQQYPQAKANYRLFFR